MNRSDFNESWLGKASGCSIFASELYVLRDNHLALRSDVVLTDQSIRLWKRLLADGFALSVYDAQNPGNGLTRLATAEDLDKFISDDNSCRRYRFVISEDGIKLAETRVFFNTRRLRELSGLGTENE